MVNNNFQEEKTFFSPGDIVQIRQPIPNAPKMLVVRIERSIMKGQEDKSPLRGCKCRWFTKDGLLQEAIFNTKDLILIK